MRNSFYRTYSCSLVVRNQFTFVELFLNIIIHWDGVGGSPEDISWISHVVNMSKYDINIKVK